MSTLTIELPQTLLETIQDQNVPFEEVQAVIVKAVDEWLQSRSAAGKADEQDAKRSRFATSATPFTEKLIRENRDLFERLAQL